MNRVPTENLIASGLIDSIVKRLAREIAAQVFSEDRGGAVVIGGGKAGDVRTDKDVGQVPEGAIGRQWLLLEDIQSRARDLSFA